MNNIYTDSFSEAFAESNPYEYKQKYTSKKGKQSSLNKDTYTNETSFTKKAKSYKQQARDAKRMNWEMN
jgi:hypothetical protein